MLTIKPDKKTGRPMLVYRLGVVELAAAMLSWYINKSILWVIIHPMFGYFYIVYAIIQKLLYGGHSSE